MLLDMNAAISHLSQRRKVFYSEADFQLELAWLLKEMYPHAKVRMEYCPDFDDKMHIDILVIIDGKMIPIELKYKTKKCEIPFEGEVYRLKNHSAKDVNCYLYLQDIQRIERIQKTVSCFAEGYTIFITNDISYSKAPAKKDCIYAAFPSKTAPSEQEQ